MLLFRTLGVRASSVLSYKHSTGEITLAATTRKHIAVQRISHCSMRVAIARYTSATRATLQCTISTLAPRTPRALRVRLAWARRRQIVTLKRRASTRVTVARQARKRSIL